MNKDVKKLIDETINSFFDENGRKYLDDLPVGGEDKYYKQRPHHCCYKRSGHGYRGCPRAP